MSGVLSLLPLHALMAHFFYLAIVYYQVPGTSGTRRQVPTPALICLSADG